MESFVHVIIRNIPANYHSADLRNFFSQFIESGCFNCFHFRHRPETILTAKITNDSLASSTDTNVKSKSKTMCCVVQLTSDNLSRLLKMYNEKHWLDKNGDSMTSVCLISKIRVMNKDAEKSTSVYKTRGEMKTIPDNRETFTEEDLDKLPELHPPPLMKNGNVGTPTMVFLDLIKQCKLPPSLIKKLGLTFPRTRTKKRFGQVPYDYGGTVEEGSSADDVVLSRDGAEIEGFVQNSGNFSEQRVSKEKVNETATEATAQEDSDPDNDDDTCEEWERHEALYDDPDNQERNKERLFEEEIELKWEKGGSGLVFYTDAQYWQEKEGDFDEQTTDDWDVDMSIYYDKTAGDMDARDLMTLRRDENRRKGIYDENDDIFKKKRRNESGSESEDDNSQNKIGKFEKHTKGVGRKILQKQGWKEGEGLGSTVTGISQALENDGQNPKCKHGFGYYGEKLAAFSGVRNPKQTRSHTITTVYDNPQDTDPPETLTRRNDHYRLKYRPGHIAFKKSADPS